MKTFLTRRTSIILGGAALLATGGIAGTVAGHMMQPSVEMAPMKPVAIRTLTADSDAVVTVRGRVTDVFGNKFVLDDGSARALVDTGRTGDGTTLVAGGNAVTVQGRFDRGQIRASFLVGADGKVTSLAPVGGPRHGPDGGPDRGPGGDHGPKGRPGPRTEGVPPVAPTAATQAPAPAPATNAAAPAA